MKSSFKEDYNAVMFTWFYSTDFSNISHLNLMLLTSFFFYFYFYCTFKLVCWRSDFTCAQFK